MKIFKKILVIVIVCFAFCHTILAKKPIKVGIYESGAGVEGIKASLQSLPGWNIEVIKDLRKKTLARHDVLVFSNTGKLAETKEDPILNIASFVQSGRGVLFTHNACGRYGVFKESIFPSIALFDGKSDDFELKVKNKKHPITSGLPKKFKHSYLDHIILKAGKKGKVLVEDAYGDPVVVAGEPIENSNGKVVYMGNIPGIETNEKEGIVKGAELKLLINTLKWLAPDSRRQFSEEAAKVYLAQRNKILKAQREEATGTINPEKLKKKNFKWKAMYLSMNYPGFYTRSAVKTMVADVKRMGINAVLPYIVSGYVHYLTKQKEVDVFSPYLEAGFDPLKVMCQEAHKKGVAVIPIVCTFSEHRYSEPTSFILKHPEFRQISKKEKMVDGLSTSSPSSCPDRPEVRERFLSIIREIVTRYDVDGISLDHIRYSDNRSCWCPYSIKKRNEFAEKHPELSHAQVEAAFSEEMIVSFVKEIRKVMDAVSPDLILHAYTHPSYATKFPLNYHSKRTTSAHWDVKNNKPADSNFGTLKQTYQAARNNVRMSRRVHRYTRPAPMVDIASRTPLERIWQGIRTVGKAGANDIILMGYHINHNRFKNWNAVTPQKKIVCEELGGHWRELPVPEDIRPRIKAKPNLLSNASFEQEENGKLSSVKLEYGKITISTVPCYGKKSVLLERSGCLSWEPVAVESNKPYTLSAWVKVIGQKRGSANIYLQFQDKDFKNVYTRYIGLPGEEFLKDWYRIEVSRIAPGKACWAKIKIVWKSELYLDAVKLEKYPIASNFE